MSEFLYKYGLVIFLVLVISVLAYQKEANEVVPNQHVVIQVNTPIGVIPVMIEKGLLNEANEGHNWITLEEFKNKMIKRKPQPRVDNRHTFEANKGEK